MTLKDYKPLTFCEIKNYHLSEVPYYFFSFNFAHSHKLFIRKNKKGLYQLTGYGFHQSPLYYTSSFTVYLVSFDLVYLSHKFKEFILQEFFRGQNELF